MTKRKAAAPQSAGDTSGFAAAVPPVPPGNGLAFPEFAAALKALQQAEAAQKSKAYGRQRMLTQEDEEAHYGSLGEDDDGAMAPHSC